MVVSRWIAQVAEILMTASVGLMTVSASRSSKRTSRGLYIVLLPG